MTRALSFLFCCCLALLASPAQARVGAEPQAWGQPASAGRDLADIRKSGVLRVLVNQSRNSSGEVKGQAIGVEQHRLRAFQLYLNRQVRDGRNLEFKLIPKAKDQLLSALQNGEGDLIAPGELLNLKGASSVNASAVVRATVPLVLVSRQGSRRIRDVEQLSGRSVALPLSSAAGDAVRRINQQLALRHLQPIVIEWVHPSLAVEDVLEMVQAGIYPVTVVEQPIAERWAKVMPKLRVDRLVVFSNDSHMNWFVRRDAPMLRASIDLFAAGYSRPEDQDVAFQRIYRRLYTVHYPLAKADLRRLVKLRPVLQRNATEYGLDWLALAALAFKESTLDPKAQGAGGATGLMQITPSAARSVGVDNIKVLDNNVLAASRYMARLRREFFSSPRLDEHERLAFVLAAYNLGPERVQSLRAEARRRGLNANQWFFQVERVAMEQLGMGVVSYVSAVNKYFVAFDRERYRIE